MNKEVKKQTNIEEAYKRRWPSFVPTTTGDRVGDIAPFYRPNGGFPLRLVYLVRISESPRKSPKIPSS